jgi:hypothetical protein
MKSDVGGVEGGRVEAVTRATEVQAKGENPETQLCRQNILIREWKAGTRMSAALGCGFQQA